MRCADYQPERGDVDGTRTRARSVSSVIELYRRWISIYFLTGRVFATCMMTRSGFDHTYDSTLYCLQRIRPYEQ
eukprot:COSAG02_NODE_39496_length_416_cov_1.041009_1_plen_73_part_01